MTPKEKAKELKSQFGDNAKYVVLEIIDILKPIQDRLHYNETLNIEYWQEVKEKIESNSIKQIDDL